MCSQGERYSPPSVFYTDITYVKALCSMFQQNVIPRCSRAGLPCVSLAPCAIPGTDSFRVLLCYDRGVACANVSSLTGSKTHVFFVYRNSSQTFERCLVHNQGRTANL